MEMTIIEEYTNGKEVSEEHTVEGVGKVKVFGELDVEKLVQKLFKTEVDLPFGYFRLEIHSE